VDPRQLTQVGPYTVRRYIAEGGMAWVFEVADPNFTERSLALKVLKPDAGQGSEQALFVEEANRLARINHPNVVQVFDSGSDPNTGLYYYTMNMIEGPSLWELVKREGALDSEQACEIFLGVLAGLEQIHNQNVVHRDITPRNIMVVPPDNRAIVMDLGIARETSDAEATQYTQVIRGTPLYMSPEQSAGRRPTKASDIFSLGLSFYYALKGVTVYDETAAVDSSNSHSVREYLGHLKYANQQFDMKLPRKVPKPVQDVVRAACQLDPALRYPDAGAMREALRAAVKAGGGGVPGWLKAGVAVAAAGVGLYFAAPPVIGLVQGFLAEDATEEPPVKPRETAGKPPPEKPEAPGKTVEPGGLPPEEVTRLEQSATAVRQTALAAARQAEGAQVEAREYRQLMDELQGDLAKAEKSFEQGDFGMAKELYIQGERKSKEALAVGQATEALEQATLLRKRADLLVAEGLLEDRTRTAVLISRAKRNYSNQHFLEAAEVANEAIEQLEGILPANVPPRLVSRDPKDATVPIAGPTRRKPDVTFKVNVEDLDGDKLQFDWAVDGNKRDEKTPELTLTKVGADADVTVRVSDGKGGQLQERWRVEYNERPTLTVTPRGKSISVKEGASQKIVAKAKDPDGDSLTTEILIDGKPVKSGSGEVVYEFEASEPGTRKVEIRTADGLGGSDETTRTLTVAARVNQRPKLSIDPPRSRTLSLTPGQKLRFTARASDPDGSEVTTEVFLDGKKVKSGGAGTTTWDFDASKTGTYKVEIRTTDPDGGTLAGTRTITVAEKVAKATPPPAPRPSKPKPPPAPPPSSTNPRDQLVATLKDYERAFESCNTARLQRIWRMTPGQLKAYRSICAEGNPSVLADPQGPWNVSGDAGWMCMQYEVTIRAGGTTVPLQKKGKYKGNFVKRPDGWQVTTIKPGGCG
jgi:serine/threonine-protein kinase